MEIKRRDFLKLVGAGFSLSALGCNPAGKAPGGNRPNIILCMADDQGWGDVGYYGHPVLKTPNLDALSRSGVRFDRFYAAAPVCSPTRGSVLTGRHPNRFGCFSWGRTLRPQEITLAEALKTAGYVTGHFGKWHLGSVQKGSPVNPGASGFDEWFSAPNFFDNDPILSREGVAVQTTGESSLVTVDAAIDFIRRHAGRSKPFLAVVWFGSPHLPYRAAERYKTLYEGRPEKLQNYYGEITGLDYAVGKLRDELRSLGIHRNTILWYTSDNGGYPGVSVTGGRGHKGQIYEGGLRVPAILEWPARIPNPRVNNLPACTSDISPTLLDITGVKVRNQPPLDGISLVPLIEGKMKSRPKPIGFWQYPGGGVKTPSAKWMAELLEAQKAGRVISDSSRLRLDAAVISRRYPEDSFPGHAAWLDWPWKLHRIQDKNGRVTYELYNLVEDPEEKNNLYQSRPERAESMNTALEDWLKSVVRSLNGEDYRGTAG